jgi:hypothetical protein
MFSFTYPHGGGNSGHVPALSAEGRAGAPGKASAGNNGSAHGSAGVGAGGVELDALHM